MPTSNVDCGGGRRRADQRDRRRGGHYETLHLRATSAWREVIPFQESRHTPPVSGTSAVKVPFAQVTGTVGTVLNAEAPARRVLDVHGTGGAGVGRADLPVDGQVGALAEAPRSAACRRRRPACARRR